MEVTSTSPLTIQYVINPKAVWSDGVPVTADDFIYAWQSQRGDGVDVDGQPDQVASTLGYRDVASVTASHDGKTVTVVFATPFTDWRVMFDHMVPAHIARRVGWNHGFDTFNPAVDLSAGPLMLQSVSPDGRAVLVRNPKWWGTPSVLDRVTVNVAASQAAWTGALAVDNQAVVQPDDFDLQLAGRGVGAAQHPERGQALAQPARAGLQRDLAGDVGQPAARQAIAHAIDRTASWHQTFGSIDPALAVNQDHLAVASQPSYNQSSAAGEYSTRGPGRPPTGCSGASATTRTRPATTSTTPASR